MRRTKMGHGQRVIKKDKTGTGSFERCGSWFRPSFSPTYRNHTPAKKALPRKPASDLEAGCEPSFWRSASKPQRQVAADEPAKVPITRVLAAHPNLLRLDEI